MRFNNTVGNVSFELVGRVRFKAKGQAGLAPTLCLLCPLHDFFITFSRSAGIFRDTKTSRCHVTGGLPPLNNACLFWEILPRAKATFGISSIILAAAAKFHEGATNYCDVCLFFGLWPVCLPVWENGQPAAPSHLLSHLNKVAAAVWALHCPHLYKRDQAKTSKKRSYNKNHLRKRSSVDDTSTTQSPRFNKLRCEDHQQLHDSHSPPPHALSALFVPLQVFMSRHFLYNCSQPILDVKIAFCQVCVPYR